MHHVLGCTFHRTRHQLFRSIPRQDKPSTGTDPAVQVFAALRTAEGMLEPAQYEIFTGFFVGRPFYLPRVLACCMGRRREFPHDRMKSLCHTMRCVARVQLGMISLFNSGSTEEETASLQSSLPKDVLPGLVEGLDGVLQVCSLSVQLALC